MTHRLCLIFNGGEGAPVAALPPADLVIAADSGLHLAHHLQVRVDLVVGDFDSATETSISRAVSEGVAVDRHPVDKDATDLDLAMQAAANRGATRTIIVGGASTSRLDHVLTTASVISADRFEGIHPEWWVDTSVLIPTRTDVTIAGTPGDVVSIVPMGGDAVVSTHGLCWPLVRETLAFGSSRGVSNEIVDDGARVIIHEGRVLVAHVKDPQ